MGDLSGNLTLPKISGLPPLAWRVQVHPAAGESLAFDATASAPGLELQLALTLPTGDAPGTWRSMRSRVDAAALWRFLVEHGGLGGQSIPTDLELTGTLAVEGNGQWGGDDFSGTLRFALAPASVRSAAQKWSADGVALDGEIEVAAARVALRSVRLRAEKLEVATLAAHNFLIEARGAEGGRVAVTRAEVAAFGGRIALTPFTLDPAAPAMNTVAEFSNVELGELAALVPQALSGAHGRVAGRVAINWSLRSGLGSGDGTLVVLPAEPATVRLAPSAGLLTGRAPARLDLLPGFMGPLRRWVSLENPAYGMLQRIELGQAPLAVESMNLRLYPDGPGGPRSASVELVTRPTGAGDVVDKVTFSVNVSGPLDQVLRLGLDDRAKISGTVGK